MTTLKYYIKSFAFKEMVINKEEIERVFSLLNSVIKVFLVLFSSVKAIYIEFNANKA